MGICLEIRIEIYNQHIKSHIDNKIIENRNASRRRTLYFLCVLVCNVIHDKMHELKSFWIVSKCKRRNVPKKENHNCVH